MEPDPVDARLERGGEVGDPAVVVRRLVGDALALAVQLDADAGRGTAALGVEDVGRERHDANLPASRRRTPPDPSSHSRSRVRPWNKSSTNGRQRFPRHATIADGDVALSRSFDTLVPG